MPWFLMGLIAFLIGHIYFIVALYDAGAKSFHIKSFVPLALWGIGIAGPCLQALPPNKIELMIGIPFYASALLFMV